SVRGDALDEEVVLAGGDDDVVRLVPARDLVRNRLRRAGRLDADERLLESQSERVRDGDDLQDVVGGEARVARPDRCLRHPDASGDPPEGFAPVRLQRLDDALVERIDSARSPYRPAAHDTADRLGLGSTQSEAIRTMLLAIGQSTATHLAQTSRFLLNSTGESWMLGLHPTGEERSMPRTPLAQRLQETVSVVAEAAERGTAVERVLEERTTRRELLKRGGAVGVGAAAAGTMGRFAKAAYGAT